MHELAIAHGIVATCEQSAGGRKVVEVVLRIGTLSGVVPEAVEFCFDACAKGTLLEGTRLVIERVEAKARCSRCRAEFPVQAYFDPCPLCGALGNEILAGEELRVREIEVE